MSDIFTVIFLLIFAILVLVIFWVSQSFMKTQNIERFGGIMPHLDATITANIKQIASDKVLENTLLSNKSGDIDPRIQHVLDKAETMLSHHGIEVETDDLYLHAQNIFYQLKEDSNTSV